MQLTNKQLKRADMLDNLLKKGEVSILEEISSVYEQIDQFQERIDTFSRTINDSLVHLVRMVETVKKMKGEDGYTPIKGVDYKDGENYVLKPSDLDAIAKKVNVPVVEKVIEKTTEVVVKEQPIVKTEIVKETTIDKSDSGEEIVSKINELPIEADKQIDAKHIKGLPIFNGSGGRPALQVLSSGVKVGTKTIELNFVGPTVTDTNGRITVTTGSGKLTATGTVDGSNTSFTFSSAPSIIFVDDGAPLQQIDQNGDVNWTGTTSVTLTNAPTRSIFGL